MSKIYVYNKLNWSLWYIDYLDNIDSDEKFLTYFLRIPVYVLHWTAVYTLLLRACMCDIYYSTTRGVPPPDRPADSTTGAHTSWVFENVPPTIDLRAR